MKQASGARAAERPEMPKGYGIPPAKKAGDYVPWRWAEERLKRARNYWVATTRPEGRPHLMPVWGVWVGGAFYFGTDRRSRKARNLAKNPAIAVHAESLDDAVILEGEVRDARPEMKRVDAAYRKKYGMKLSDAPGESAYYEVRPRVVFGWSEKTFAKKATRWRA